jgi:hypothetical protein
VQIAFCGGLKVRPSRPPDIQLTPLTTGVVYLEVHITKRRRPTRRCPNCDEHTCHGRFFRIVRHFQPKLSRIRPVRNGSQPGLRNGTEELQVVIIEVNGAEYVRTIPRGMAEEWWGKQRR